ncbi:MAG: hypothetical protein E6Q97_22325 [Desulfurellales bacterium]|nr:MAG: hypothetical protein E6Q97_22325 [Desulfurellales bacterium]
MLPEDYPVIDAADARRKAVIGLESGYVGIGALCKYILRILDAFEAMEREGWTIRQHWHFEKPYWVVFDRDLNRIGEAASPLAALLAASDTLNPKGT